MKNLKNSLFLLLKEHLNEDISQDMIQLGTPPNENLGDYALACFPFAKAFGKNPVEIAKDITEVLSKSTQIESAQATGPYVNMKLSSGFFAQTLQDYHLPKYEQNNKTVIVDYYQVNIGKPLHVGHLCTPSYGQAVINLLRYMGYEVIADMHQGDWGGIFGKLIVGWKKYGDETLLESTPIDHLLDLYIKITAEAEQDEAIEQACRDAFKQLSDGDTESVDLWKRFTSLSLTNAQNVGKQILAQPDMHAGESFYEGIGLPKIGSQPDLAADETMSSVVRELTNMGIATKNDDGSTGVVFPKESKLPSTILQKRDGTHGYFASDLSCVKYRTNNWSPEKILYFVDNRQSLHFRQVFNVAKRAWKKAENTELVHAGNGFISLPDGAMSTRKGRIIRLEDVVTEGIIQTKNILEAKDRHLSEEDIEKIAICAIKYALLGQDREKDIVFDWDKMLSFEGNSGPYIQYSYVRAKKLLGELADVDTSNIADVTLTKYDTNLVKLLCLFEEKIQKMAETYKPHHLASYCYDMATNFSSFYANTGKLTELEDQQLQAFRKLIIQKYVEAIETSFKILALPLPSQM